MTQFDTNNNAASGLSLLMNEQNGVKNFWSNLTLFIDLLAS